MCGTGGNLNQGPQGGVDEFLGMRQGKNGQVYEPGAFEKPFRFDNQTGPAPSTSTLSLYTLCIPLHSAKITFSIALPRHRTGHGQHCPGREAWYTVPSPPACVSSDAFSSSPPATSQSTWGPEFSADRSHPLAWRVARHEYGKQTACLCPSPPALQRLA